MRNQHKINQSSKAAELLRLAAIERPTYVPVGPTFPGDESEHDARVRREVAKIQYTKRKYAKGSSYDLSIVSGKGLPEPIVWQPARPGVLAEKFEWVQPTENLSATDQVGESRWLIRSERRSDIRPYDGLKNLRWRDGSPVLPSVPTSGHALSGYERNVLLGSPDAADESTRPISTEFRDWSWQPNDEKSESVTWLACTVRGCAYSERLPQAKQAWRLESDDHALESYRDRWSETGIEVPRSSLTPGEVRDHDDHALRCDGELYQAGVHGDDGSVGFTIPMARLTVQGVKVMSGPNSLVAQVAGPGGACSSVVVRNAEGKVIRPHVSGLDGRKNLRYEKSTVAKRTSSATATGKKRAKASTEAREASRQAAHVPGKTPRRVVKVDPKAATPRVIRTLEIGVPTSTMGAGVREAAEKMLKSNLIG